MDEREHMDRNKHKENEREIKQELDCKFIRIIPNEKNFDLDKYLNEIQSYIITLTIELTKKETKKLTEKEILN